MVRSLLVASMLLMACAAKEKSQEKTGTANTDSARSTTVSVPVDTITQPPSLACFSQDSGPLQFGEIVESGVDQDVSGVSYTFNVTSSGMVGSVVDARGEASPSVRLQGLQYRPTSDSLVFWYAGKTGARCIFSFHPTCDSMVGKARLFVTDTDTGQVAHEIIRRSR